MRDSVRPRTTKARVPKAVLISKPGMKIFNADPRFMGDSVNAFCQTNPSNRIAVWEVNRMSAEIMKAFFISELFLDAHSAALPEINAPIGKAIKKPPVLPRKCCHPEAPPENTPSPNPPTIKYKITAVMPTLVPKTRANQTTSKD